MSLLTLGERTITSREFLLKHLKPYRVKIGIGIFLIITSVALAHANPWLIGEMVDYLNGTRGVSKTIHFFSGTVFGEHTELYNLIAGILIATFIYSIFLFFQRYIIITISRKIEYSMRNELFEKLQHQPRTFFDSNLTGDIMSRCTNDLDRVRDLVGPALMHMIRMGAYLVYTTAILLTISPTLAAVGLTLSLALPLTTLKFMKQIYAGFAAVQKSLSKLSSFSQELFSSISTIKSFGNEEYFIQKFEQSSLELKATSKKITILNSFIWPTIGFISGVGICAAIFTGSYLITEQELTTGELTKTVFLLLNVQFPLVGLGWVMSMVQRGRASLDRIISLMNTMEEGTYIRPANEPFHSLRMTGLNFTYPQSALNSHSANREKQAPLSLSDIDLDIVKGSSLGVVGKIGSGKTSLIKILTGTYPIAKGTFYINGKDVSEQSRDWCQSFFSLSPQDGFLFSESIRENVLLGTSPTTSLSVEEAANLAALTKDLYQIPGELDAVLGEKGINLSGGQRQRVGLARALIANPDILILDDTLSAVDTETEHEILHNLKTHITDLTTVIISHKYSSVIQCDEIIYLENGEIKERGTHTKLMALDGHYAENYRQQILSYDLEEQ
ncbi:MAG: ABC transporter ATP-binding protein/permease [Fibrobacterales bacterium]